MQIIELQHKGIDKWTKIEIFTDIMKKEKKIHWIPGENFFEF